MKNTKKLFYLLFLVSFSAFCQIPNAVGDGVTDDTDALQDWLDGSTSGAPVGDEIYLIKQQLEIDELGDQLVNFFGATITVDSTGDFYAILVDKPDRSTTTLSNLNIDGNILLRNGIDVASPLTADNVDIFNLYHSNSSVIAWKLYINSNNYGSYNFDNCDVYDIESLGDLETGNGKGSARMMDIQWQANPPETTVITYENFEWDGCYGDDGGPIRIDDMASGVEFSLTNHKSIFRNGVIKDFIRRGTKLGCDNVEFYNISWAYALASDPKFESNPAGIIGVRPTPHDPNGKIENIIYDSCTFDNTTYSWAILDKMDNVTISNCTFLNGAGIRIDNLPDSFMGNWTICNTTFSAASQIKDQDQGTGLGQLAGTKLTYATSNNRTASSIINFDNTNASATYGYDYIEFDCVNRTGENVKKKSSIIPLIF